MLHFKQMVDRKHENHSQTWNKYQQNKRLYDYIGNEKKLKIFQGISDPILDL